ncbi:hypothetical protein [Nevskia soli]|uniref:hypothetical protein n=1 Tax=Nevskia soli TaxID=418856 RepID=UPI0015D88C7F|nr:hypothetical protein [Nevskia soli]
MALTTAFQRKTGLLTEFADTPAGLAGAPALLPDGKPNLKPRAFNALKHGLTGVNLFISADEIPFYAQMGMDFFREIRPVGTREIAYAQFLFEGTWRLNRIRSVENDLFCFKPEDEAGNTTSRPPGWERQVNAYREDFRRIDLISRYESRIVRNCARIEAELDKLQKRRGRKQLFDEKSSPAIAWYQRLLSAVATLEQANSPDPQAAGPAPDEPPKNSNKTVDRKPVTPTAAAGSNEISFGKKHSPPLPDSAPPPLPRAPKPKAKHQKAA